MHLCTCFSCCRKPSSQDRNGLWFQPSGRSKHWMHVQGTHPAAFPIQIILIFPRFNFHQITYIPMLQTTKFATLNIFFLLFPFLVFTMVDYLTRFCKDSIMCDLLYIHIAVTGLLEFLVRVSLEPGQLRQCKSITHLVTSRKWR